MKMSGGQTNEIVYQDKAQEWELIDQLIANSKRYREEITITKFEPVQDIEIQGVVMAIDKELRRIKLQWNMTMIGLRLTM